MGIVDATQINSFASMAQQANVSPEEPIFVLASNQIQALIKQAIQDALESPKDLGQIVLDQAREIQALNAKLEAIQKDMDSLADNQLIQLRLINDLRHKEPGKMEISRAEKIEKYLEARPDHKATYETLKGYLGIKNDLLNDAINVLMAENPGKYSIVKDPGDKRKRSLVMLARY